MPTIESDVFTKLRHSAFKAYVIAAASAGQRQCSGIDSAAPSRRSMRLGKDPEKTKMARDGVEITRHDAKGGVQGLKK